MAECSHAWQETGGASRPGCVVTHQRCPRCNETRSVETHSDEWSAQRLREASALRGHSIEMSALDRADVWRELEIRAGQCEDIAQRAAMNALGDESPAARWRDRARRIRQLMQLFGGTPC